MDIIVLIKQVPDTTDVKLDPKTGSLIREGVESIINPDDRHALEAAVNLKEEKGGKVTVISMGPPQAIDAISEALGMGADEGILLSDKAFAGADTWATSFTLGKAIEKVGKYDLVICGRQAIDGDTAQIGPQVAEYLRVPQVTYVCGIEKVGRKKIVLKRRLEDGFERVQCPLPALLTVIKEVNVPRFPRLGGLIDACGEKANIKVWNAADIGAQTRDVGLEGSLTHVIKTFAPKFKRQGEILEGESKEVVNTLVDKLVENNLI
ncbi:MAG: electron transfer flavoprotein subunit beta/FixA family protein [Deltaproteobacteria bacterium]|nr:electron transfer flavoprotein subunit beta/FixA family protein [Deltaproteobacteria bacterium]MBW1919350.1 electron transfer flavoprotein subunit beta/FixA family protein [Deltaproteobacteria bacterium]MBW1934080.1 electron transfer flavoprotein subunit beta/FixA family protein [Deltaproteobacteria bacterium]MBW1976348.1 electron transfer flavoprotein subunit beta/FixA family protein [Deltaproteobacteria bacterium]MBW2043374.1 electron transfer flavoprotein subunit beta/FixA family protein 